MPQIETVSDLTYHYEMPTILALKKNLDYIDAHARAFIARSPFLVLSTADADGWPDASPRGDPSGFVAVDGERTILIPDRPGNNRVDSFRNVVANPKVGISLSDPRSSAFSKSERNGTAPHRRRAVSPTGDARKTGALRIRGHRPRGILSLREIADPLADLGTC